jgi:hypothetical protein
VVKNVRHEPEKMTTLPENERLMPEKNLKIQLPSSLLGGLGVWRLPISSAISTISIRQPEKAPPFTLFRFVPLCSAKKISPHANPPTLYNLVQVCTGLYKIKKLGGGLTPVQHDRTLCE